MADAVVYLCRECGATFEMPPDTSPGGCARCGAGRASLRKPATELPQLNPDIRALAIALVGAVAVIASPAVGMLVALFIASLVPWLVALAIGVAVTAGLAVASGSGVITRVGVR